MSFLEDIMLDVTEQKLYANYRGAGNIVVFNAEELIQRVDQPYTRARGSTAPGKFIGQDHPLDTNGFQQAVFGLFSDTPHTLEKIYEDAIDVEKHGPGLAPDRKSGESGKRGL